MESTKRHQSFSTEEITKKRHKATPDSTFKCNKKWDKVFREYLQEKNYEYTEYWCYPDDELDSILVKMWFELCSSVKDDKGEFLPYTITSLRNLRNALTRELNIHGRYIDLPNDPKYKNSQMAFKDACKELKELGRGVIHHYPEITKTSN